MDLHRRHRLAPHLQEREAVLRPDGPGQLAHWRLRAALAAGQPLPRAGPDPCHAHVQDWLRCCREHHCTGAPPPRVQEGGLGHVRHRRLPSSDRLRYCCRKACQREGPIVDLGVWVPREAVHCAAMHVPSCLVSRNGWRRSTALVLALCAWSHPLHLGNVHDDVRVTGRLLCQNQRLFHRRHLPYPAEHRLKLGRHLAYVPCAVPDGLFWINVLCKSRRSQPRSC
mmetsp:Transcript_12709/g.50795  ORF Transcript_12709/g.50795 Transcript_12709/m.50795 type:complete len:225 (+) Transcript_12709:657-1331(+)